MKKLIAIVLTLVLVLSAVGCSLFSDQSVVQFETFYTHQDPDGLKYDERKVLINQTFGAALENTVNAAAYPDVMKYDDDGNMVGMYDYDPETGLAGGYIDLSTGEYVAEEIDLGKPDTSQMIALAGDVTLGCVIYGNESKAISAFLYAFLSESSDAQTVMTSLETWFGLTMTAESDTVLVCEKDETAINAQFQLWQETYGQMQSDRSASAYADNLKLDLGLKNYGVNPYKPYSDIVDPDDIDFDERVILTSNGSYSFADQSLEKEMVARTDVVYGWQGKAVAHYTYYEYQSKDGADKLMNAQDGNFMGAALRVSNTTVQDQLIGQDLQDVIAAYIGYNVLQDDSLESYVENVEGTYFAMIYEQE